MHVDLELMLKSDSSSDIDRIGYDRLVSQRLYKSEINVYI